MRRLLASVAVGAAVIALAGCGGDAPATTVQPNNPPASAQAEAPPPPLCELLTPEDYQKFAGLTVKAPDTKDVTKTKGKCVYGDHVIVDVTVLEDASKAKENYQGVLKTPQLAVQAENPIGGVDESAYGTVTVDGKQHYGLGVRRQMLVVRMELPADTPDPRPKLLTLVGQLLQRAGALGT